MKQWLFNKPSKLNRRTDERNVPACFRTGFYVPLLNNILQLKQQFFVVAPKSNFFPRSWKIRRYLPRYFLLSVALPFDSERRSSREKFICQNAHTPPVYGLKQNNQTVNDGIIGEFINGLIIKFSTVFNQSQQCVSKWDIPLSPQLAQVGTPPFRRKPNEKLGKGSIKIPSPPTTP